MSKLVRVLIFLGAVLLVLAVMALLGVRSSSRGTLNRYKAELQASGEKLTFAELTRGRQTNAFDSHAVITNAAATLKSARLIPGVLEWQKYVGPGRATVLWRQAAPSWQPSAGSGTVGTWEEIDSQMQAAQGRLREVREGLKDPALDAGPYTNMLMSRRINFVAIRTVAQWLAGAVGNDLRQGRLEEGLQNLEALAGLARMERDEYTLVAQMIRVAVAGLGLSVTWEALQAPGWTEPQLERLQHAWEPVDLVDGLEKGFLGERASGQEVFAMLRRSSGPQFGRWLRLVTKGSSSSSGASFEDVMIDCVYFPAYKLTCMDEDELLYLRFMHDSLELARWPRTRRPWAPAKQEAAKVSARINQALGSPTGFRYAVSRMAIPNFVRAYETAVRTEGQRQLTLAAIALKRYQLRQGKWPASLEALVPEFVTAVPYDYMSAQPLRYRLKDDGSYVLYSVGEDGKDDGGDPTPPSGKASGLWEGRDAVWPSPATEPAEPLPQRRP